MPDAPPKPSPYDLLANQFTELVLHATYNPKTRLCHAAPHSLYAKALRTLASWDLVSVKEDNSNGITTTLIKKP